MIELRNRTVGAHDSGDVTWNLQKEHDTGADYDGSETGVSCEMNFTDKFLSLEQADTSVGHRKVIESWSYCCFDSCYYC